MISRQFRNAARPVARVAFAFGRQLDAAPASGRAQAAWTFTLRALGSCVVILLMSACSRQSAGERPQATYDRETGRLRTLTFDANGNGTVESTSHMDGTRILRIELDLDENGKVDRWDFYGSDRKVEKVGLSRLNDGVMDAQAFYEPEGVLARLDISTRRDGTFDRTEFYVTGALDRTTDDTNGDGRADKWETFTPLVAAGPNEPGYAITSSAFDDSGSGRPERRFVYGTGGTVARVEVDADGDGVFHSSRVNDLTP
jgi:hypothetical protein